EDDIESEREALDAAIATIEAEYSGTPDNGSEFEPEPDPVAAPEAADDWGSSSLQNGSGRDEWPEADSPSGAAPLAPAWADSDFPEPAFERDRVRDDAAAGPQEEPLYEQERDQLADPGEPAVPPQGFTLPGARQGDAPSRRQPVGDRPAERPRPRVDSVAPRTSSGGGFRAAIMALSLVIVIGAIASVAYWLSNAENDTPAPLPVVEAPPVGDDGKIDERIGGEAQQIEAAPGATATAPVQGTTAPAASATASDELTVAQRAILYEEDAANPQAEPRAAAGRAVWHLDPPAAGAVDPTVRTVVEFPDTGMTMTMTIRRNLDPTLPASHTIELAFAPGEQQGRSVRDIGLLQLKDEETVRGAPLAGLPVPVQDNFFLIGLSNIPADIQRNTGLLTSRNWIDIPIRFAAGQRAIVSFEKGMSGEQVVARAFQAWNGEATAR
ncbi:MAG TPA: hypothetical protein VLQ65_11055, partial [Saliniramus sp.]|nr:hypothetical protein [Saliniramus sp.]